MAALCIRPSLPIRRDSRKGTGGLSIQAINSDGAWIRTSDDAVHVPAYGGDALAAGAGCVQHRWERLRLECASADEGLAEGWRFFWPRQEKL